MSLDVSLYIDTDTGGPEPYRSELFDYNITHNLGPMASEAGLYNAMWRPDEHDYTEAGQLIEPLRAGLQALLDDPPRYIALEPDNGWGTYGGLVTFAAKYLSACRMHPKANVTVSR